MSQIVNRKSPNRKLPIIGLAGGIGAGKSSVAKILSELGCFVSDSDASAREALRDPRIKQTILQWWGREVLDSAGELDRTKIASMIFKDPQARRKLEQLTHPWIEARRREQFAHAPEATKALVIDAPLLLEANLDKECDAVIFVEAGRKLRLARVASARGWDEAQLALREQSQLPLDEKRRRADHMVENNGDLSELKAQVRRVLDQILDSCRH